jgi:histidyl-tRNA synthetase
MLYKTVKGMSDIVFPEMRGWQFVEKTAQRFFCARMYEEIRTPLVEHTELFQRSIGEASDIVSKEMYSFNDRGGRSLTLRPEMTASVIRAVVNNNLLGLREPLKLFYCGAMFRAERPQAGRKRQFHQIGVELIGNNDPWCDAEVIRDLAFFLRELGLKQTNIMIKVNNVGCSSCRPAFVETLRDYFSTRLDLVCENCRFKYDKNVLRIFDCKNGACSELASHAPKVSEHVCKDCRDHFEQVLAYLEQCGVACVVDKNIVRGLDYYTSTVFEVTSNTLGAQDAIAAGGRYNNLLSELGGPHKGAIGFAIGEERLLICLRDVLKKVVPDALSRSVYVAYSDNAYLESARDVIARLEKAGRAAYGDLDGRSLKSQLKRANKFGFRWVLILNKGECEALECALKDLNADSEGQTAITFTKIEDELFDKIGG